jgi:glycosyltransferase involved in cell wall biosynthesis
MKICMVTTFFGRHSYGGDSIYVERLSRALQQRGHEVHVAYSSGAFDITRDSQPLRQYQAPPQLFVHDIGHGTTGKIVALWNHQTGGVGLEFQALGSLLKCCSFDLIHLHNVSLLGGRTLPLLLNKQPRAIKLATMHDYWWICPQSLFWKYDCRICDACACKTCVVSTGRPPQFWRQRGWFNRTLAHIDAVVFPSRYAMEQYRRRGLEHPRQHVLPGLLPEDWVKSGHPEGGPSMSPTRPYFAAAGRLVAEKGFHTLVPLMRHLPEMDLRIAGSGPAEGMLRKLARCLPNVKFEGLLDHHRIRLLFRGARAVVVPSLFPETFGMVAAEAMSLGVPVLVRNRGSLPELIAATSGGLTFDCEKEMADQMRHIASDDRLFNSLSHFASARAPSVWFEAAHTDAYLKLAAETRARVMKE